MEIIKGDNFKLNKSAVCLGKFDGVHKGHRMLIDYVSNIEGMPGVMFTFDMNPRTLFDADFKTIYSEEEKISLLKNTGLDMLIEYPFTKETAALSADDFVKDILVGKLSAGVICIGKDFRFGHNRLGDLELLLSLSEKYGFKVKAFDKATFEGSEISSTRIRNLIKEGNVKKAGELLGSPYFIEGPVVHGHALGRTVGMPTANIIPDECKILPKFGVYASDIFIDGRKFRGITNIGVKPSVGDKEIPGAETLIFDFDEDIYDKIIKVELLDFIREERKMGSLKEVREQVEIDSKRARCL